MRAVSEWLQDVTGLSREAFLNLQTVPVLIHHPEDESDDPEFHTAATQSTPAWRDARQKLALSPWLSMVELKKRPGTLFESRILLGRTRNNDVVLPYAKVSKFHAYFSFSEEGQEWWVTDPGSTNGVYVNGQRLTRQTREVLSDGCVVSFGRYHFRFHTPEGLFEIVKDLRPAS